MTLRERWGRRDWLVLLGLLALTVLAWWRVLFCRSWSFGVELDFIRQFYPARFFAVKSLAGGTFPLWNPYILCGHPFFASYQTAMLYPFNLLMVGLYAAAGADFSLKAQCIFVVFHFYLAGLFTYILARELKIGRAGSTVAAVTYMFCGFMVAHAGHMNQQSAAAWIPLVFFLFYRCLDRRRLSYAAAAGVVTAVALLAGHLQSIFYLCIFLLLYVFFIALRSWRGDSRQPGLLYGLSALAVTVAVGGGLACAQLVPTQELIGLSTRSRITLDVASPGSLPRWQVINLIFPHFFGTSPKQYAGGWLMWETYGYSGIVAGALGIVALFRKRRGFVIFLWFVALLSIVLAMGTGGYLYTALFKSGLLFNRFRDPARILLMFGFASALLAGLGADHLVEVLSDPVQKSRYRSGVRLVAVLLTLVTLLAASVVLIMVARHSPRAGTAFSSVVIPTALLALLLVVLLLADRVRDGPGWLTVGLVVLVAVDLLVLNVPWVIRRVNPDDIFGDRKASRYLAAQPGVFKVETDAETMYRALDDGAIYGLEKASGDDSLVLAGYYRYRELIVSSESPGVQPGLFYMGGLRFPLLDVMNDVYFVTKGAIPEKLARGKYAYLGRKGRVNMYKNLTAMPGAWMTDSVVYKDNKEVYKKLLKDRGKGIREKAMVVYPSGTPARQGEVIPAVKEKVRVVERSPHRVVIETEPSCRGLLATAELVYPGWEASVDGKEKEILTTNYIFRGVMLEGGQRKVEFRFRPKSLYAGILISLLTAGLLLLWLAVMLALRVFRKRAGDGKS
jgi:hypothetical protein